MSWIEFLLLFVLMVLIFFIEVIDNRIQYKNELYKCFTIMCFKGRANSHRGCSGLEKNKKDCIKCPYHESRYFENKEKL